jgi:sigma54-dependent transcription regulator
MHALPNSGTSSTLAPLFIDARSRRIISQLERVAPSEASTLIVGETGTEKEVIAQQVHRRSGRSGPFVAVNCGALSETLGEAALFGHEAGAYTGASGARAGWFEAANGGTLFLDEIGDLPLTLQVALLRVPQERQVVRLGSRKLQPIDVRVIAATNRRRRGSQERQVPARPLLPAECREARVARVARTLSGHLAARRTLHSRVRRKATTSFTDVGRRGEASAPGLLLAR